MAALSNRQIARAAAVVLLGFLASGILGVVRTSVFTATFGASNALDAFFAANRIPEALFVLVAGGALGSAFIPVFSRFLQSDDAHAWQLASAVMTASAGAAGVLAAIAYITAPLFIPQYAPDPALQPLTLDLMRIMLVTPVIFAVSGLVMGILNAHQIFWLPSLAISMNNVGMIVGALVFARLFPNADGSANIYGLAWGAVLGALLHLGVQLPGLWQIRARLRPLTKFRLAGVGEVLRLMGPRVLGLGVVQINFIVSVSLASSMADGSISALTVAWQLMFFALGIIAQSVGTALFPTLSALAAAADMDGFKDRLASAMRSVLFLALPATVALMLLGRPLVALVAERGAWLPEATLGTAWALGWFALGIVGHSLLEVLSRAFYALADTWTPVLVGLASMIANIALSLVFIHTIGDPNTLSHGAFAGLALANSLTTLIEGVILWALMSRRLRGIHDARVFDLLWRTGVATALMGIALWFLRGWLVPLPSWIALGVGGLVAGIIFFGVALALRLPEAQSVPQLVLRRLRR